MTGKKVKVKFSHTRFRAFGPELIPVYRQSASGVVSGKTLRALVLGRFSHKKIKNRIER